MKILKAILAFLCLSLYAQAEGTERSLYITMKDGVTAEFNLATEPTIANDLTNMLMWVGWKDANQMYQQISYEILQIEAITFEAPSMSVKSARSAEGTLHGDYLVVPKSHDGIRVYTLDGRQKTVSTTDTDEGTMLDLRQLPKGIYVISYNGNSLKIQRQ